MKTHIVISSFILLMLSSCSRSRQEDKDKDLPEALKENNASFSSIGKRSSGDLMERLYGELVDKTPALKELEKNMEYLNKEQQDSTADFQEYDNHNDFYYTAANNKIETIKDSVLKQKLKVMIAGSVAKYAALTSSQSEWLKSIEAKNYSLEDLHILLKITKTLPIIEQYQKQHLPGINSLKALSNDFDKTINQVDSLVKK